MRRVAICFLLLGCGGGAASTEKPAAIREEAAPSAAEVPLTLERLLQRPTISIGADGKCTEWRVTRGANTIDLSHPWQRTSETETCEGEAFMTLELASGWLMMSVSAVRDIKCARKVESEWATVGLGSYCGGPYRWLVHSRSSASITLRMSPSAVDAPVQRWFPDLETCREARLPRRRAGCH